MTDKTRQVPAKTSSGFSVALILLGIAITPILLSSSSLGNQLANDVLIKALILGSLILAILAGINMSIGEKARLPTYEIVKYAFGEKGALAINILMAISLFGWIAVTANMFGESVHNLFLQFDIHIPIAILVCLGCVLFWGATTFGLAVLGKIATLAVPIIILVLAYIIFNMITMTSNAVTVGTMDLGVATSTVVGTVIVLVATSPDFGSFLTNRKHVIIATIITFVIMYPLLFWAGAFPSQKSNTGSLLAAASFFGLLLPAAFLMVFATFTANSGNLFQGTLVFSTLFPNISKKKLTFLLAVMAAIVGNLNIMNGFIPFLLFLGIVTPPVAGIYIADFLLYRWKKGYNSATLTQEIAIKPFSFIAWLLGSIIGFMTAKGVLTLTSIPSLDSILVASVSFVILNKFLKNK